MNQRRLRLTGSLALPVLFLLSCTTLPARSAGPQAVVPAGADSVQHARPTVFRSIGGVSANRLANLSRGIDLGNVFTQGANPLRYATRITSADLRIIREAGFTFCRLPISPDMLFDPSNPSRLRRNVRYVDRLVGLILDNGLSVVIDPIHIPGKDVRFERAISASATFDAKIARYWRAIASRYARLDPNRVFFEIMNEPAASRVAHAPVDWWPPVQGRLARVIRAAAPHNTIIATGDEFGGIPGLLRLTPLPMHDVVYSFHFYEPMTFTHQGATWVGSVARVLSGVPYPATPSLVASVLKRVHLPAARRALESYGRQRWNGVRIRSEIARAAAWSARYHVPLVDGEFGVYRPYAPPAARYRWIHDVRTTLEHDHIGWAMWNFDAGFNLVRYRYPGVLAGPVVDERLLAALGLKPVAPPGDGSPIARFDRGVSSRIVLPVSWLGRLWVAHHGWGSASLEAAAGRTAPKALGPVARLAHQSARAWAIRPDISFPVSSGERYRVESWAADSGPGSCALALVAYAPDGQSIGRRRLELPVTTFGSWQHLDGLVYIPRGTSRIAFQWSGRGNSIVELASISLAHLAP